MRKVLVVALSILFASVGSASSTECSADPNAIGTARTISVDPGSSKKVGTLQFTRTLPLQDHEIVLTFDDGPIPPATTDILDTLASECVKATFFLVGENAKESPDTVHRIATDGHSIGTGTQTHPHLAALPEKNAIEDIEKGIASIKAAVGDAGSVAPFFRSPYLELTPSLEEYLGGQGLMIWSIDFQADDWKDVSPDQVVSRAMEQIEAKKKGILLLHDIQRRTATALPVLLRALQNRGYKIVHIVPSTTNAAAVAAKK